MSAATVVAADAEAAAERRTFIVGVRLALAANTTLQLSLLFAYVYLKANNFGGGWRPEGTSDVPPGPQFLALILQLAALVAVLAALSGAARTPGFLRGMASAAFVLSVASVAARIYLQYNLGVGWAINLSTYDAVSMIWFAILIVETIIGALWLLTIMVPGRRVRAAVTSMQLRGFAEFWLYLTVLSTGVWLLVRFV